MQNSPFEQLREYASSLVDSVDEATTRFAVSEALRDTTSAVLPLRRRIATVGMVVGTFLSANVGLAAASQGAVPGDFLYPVDRAYERLTSVVGLGGDHAVERLQEAVELSRRGDIGLALETAQAGIENLDSFLEDPGLAESSEAMGQIAEAAAENRPGFVDEINADAHRLVELAKSVVEAAHGDDVEAVREAAHLMREQAQILAAKAKANRGNSGDNPGRGNGPPADPGSQGQGQGQGPK
ncbi:MAG: DUF5667 domain-containing protein [Acidimicrobiia bacterium]|nr:DUF5667 domain-containing protein [Acidimicrobiia bacterium]